MDVPDILIYLNFGNPNDYKFLHLLNGALEEKNGTLIQIKINEFRRQEERRKPCDPVSITC